MEDDQWEFKMKFISMKNIILKRGKRRDLFSSWDGKNIIVERPGWISIGEEREETREKEDKKI